MGTEFHFAGRGTSRDEFLSRGIVERYAWIIKIENLRRLVADSMTQNRQNRWPENDTARRLLAPSATLTQSSTSDIVRPLECIPSQLRVGALIP
jgi:hypothetical protein